MKPFRTVNACLVLALALTLTGCQSNLFDTQEIPEGVKGLAKTGVDPALDAHLNATTNGLDALMRELYRLNPQELEKTPGATVGDRVVQLLPGRLYDDLIFAQLAGKRGIDAMQLAFDPEYIGDRVFALMVGLVSQMRIAYNDKLEFFALHRLDATNLENFATNLEIVQFSLTSQTNASGVPLLQHAGEVVTTGTGLPAPSVEQIINRLIGHQQVLVDITSGWRDRAHRDAVRTVGTLVLLPIPIP